ncbi:MAG TPA: shikimate dehydrogenase [Microbacterium sp.]|nr:shikimate dehydrogenase [Microbacterium sp.]
MLRPGGSRLEVWGDPVAHSLSPKIHSAAYRALGLDWTYEQRRVPEAAFADQFAGLSDQWRGLSLTMPLKGAAHGISRWRDRPADLTRAVNTLLLTPDGPRGFNTDVGGLVRALEEQGVVSIDSARIVGAGATASSAIVALGELGAQHVEVVARRRTAVAPIADLGAAIGIDVVGAAFDDARYRAVPVTIATLPGDAQVPDATADALASSGGLLLDAVYGNWPTALADAWARAGHPATSGLGMLLHQALLQVRVFATGSPAVALEDETSVLAAMRGAVMGD